MTNISYHPQPQTQPKPPFVGKPIGSAIQHESSNTTMRNLTMTESNECSRIGCNADVFSAGLCGPHYGDWLFGFSESNAKQTKGRAKKQKSATPKLLGVEYAVVPKASSPRVRLKADIVVAERKIQRNRRNDKIKEMLVEGKTTRKDIEDKFGVSRGTVFNMANEIGMVKPKKEDVSALPKHVKHRPYPDETIQQVKTMLLGGMSRPEIQRKTGVNRGKVFYIAEELGLTTPRVPAKELKRGTRYSAKVKNRVKNLLLTTKKGQTEIAKEIGVSRSYVFYTAQDLGLTTPKPKRSIRYSDEVKKQVENLLLDTDMQQEEIAEILNVGKGTVHRMAEELGIVKHRKPVADKQPDELDDINQQIHALLDSGMNCAEVARTLGVSYGRVNRQTPGGQASYQRYLKQQRDKNKEKREASNKTPSPRKAKSPRKTTPSSEETLLGETTTPNETTLSSEKTSTVKRLFDKCINFIGGKSK